ncbi:hypothetical protein GCM10028803_46890 [Larkinella knui]|uniref:DUF4595 domain-containing protein n=1 Tax=Larkinella knui TaxID=2025310 RepID=A0A3P1CPM9_9BACT|nr:hypothetical protein [Larkinella knui]RRB15277.1 hypothetical protein EHT87_12115 [Larkinella knui]
MNFIAQLRITCIGLLVLTGIVSCNRETAISPVQPSTQQPTVGLDDGEILVTAAKKYLLTKQGNTTLTYYANGKLKRVTYSPTRYIDYTYQDSTRVFSSEYNDNKLDVVTTYYIHKAMAAGGQPVLIEPANPYYKNYPDQCYLVKTEKYMHYKQGDEIVKTERLYTYNDKGQIANVNLSNFQEAYYPYKRIDFTYNTNGDLTKATEYNTQNVKIRESTYEYTAFGDPIRNDRNPFNPEELQVDPYVTVFGKYSKHLARGKKMETFAPYNLVSNSYYQYAINLDGYVTKQDTYAIFNAQLIQSTPYEYFVTNPRIQ